MWFSAWSELWRVLAVGTVTYVTIVVALRVSGKRTLSKLNAFDLVVTVALGSTLATILLSSDVSWSEGASAVVLLVVLQLLVATLTRTSRGRAAVTSTPTLLLSRGVLIEGALRRQRITEADLRQAVRTSGQGDLSDVAAVVLESDGSLSVIPTTALGSGSALIGVSGAADLVPPSKGSGGGAGTS